jgi:BlaI family transcriptional regulator, penicillinase repressor
VTTRKPDISDTELEVLRVLWDHGPGTVRELKPVLKKAGRHWAYTTVQTLLNRLEAKGFVKSDKGGFAHVFHAAMSRNQLMRQRLKDLADELCDGAATPLLLALVGGQRFTPEELGQFRKLLDDLDKRKKKSGS